MLEALKAAPGGAEGFRAMVRWNLGAWLGQVHKPLRFLDAGHCNHLAFSPDGRSFASGNLPSDRSGARPVELWETATGRKLATFPGAFAPFAFLPDGQALLASADNGRRMVAVEPATGRVRWTSPPLTGEWWDAIHFSPDGSTLLTGRHVESGQIHLLRLDLLTGQVRGEELRGWGWMAVAPDGRTVATGRVEDGEPFVDAIDLPSGRRNASWRAGGQGLNALDFSPDGNSLYVSIADGLVNSTGQGQIWDPGTGRPIGLFMARAGYATYVPSADRLVTDGDFFQSVRDAATGRERGSKFPGASTTSHPDGRTMLTSALDDTFRLWQLSAEAEPVPEGSTGSKRASTPRIAARTPWRGFNAFRAGRLRADGRIALSLAEGAGGRELVRLSAPGTGRPSGRPAPHYPGRVVRAVAFSPDGRWFATGSNPLNQVSSEVRLWDVATGRLLLPPIPLTNWAAALAFHPDGKVLAVGDYNGMVRTWDTTTGREIGRPLPQGEIVLSLAYSPDGQTIAAGLARERGKPGTRLWDAGTRQPIGELLPGTQEVSSLEFSPDGRALLAGSGYSSRLWDATRGRLIGGPMPDEMAGGFRPDGRAFLTLGSGGTVDLRDASDGAVLGRLLTGSSRATCAAFRGDGGLVAAGFEDGSVRLCDPVAKQPVGPPRFLRHAVHHVAFTADGRSVAAIDEQGESRTWPVPGPLTDASLDDLTLRVEARTGLRMETSLAISRLDGRAWRERLERLDRLDPAALSLDDGPDWHEPMALEAEQEGNAFAATWHLDRLIAAHPDDWSLYARRARARSLSDKFAEAAEDYRQAERLGNREDVLDFQAHCVVDITRAGRWAEALWYLDRLIVARPEDGSLHESRAAVCGKLGREAERQAELARVFELGADEGMVLPRAEELGRLGRWAEAAGLLTRCGRRGSVSRELAQAWGVACVKAGDHAGYREACAAFMAWEGPNPTVVWNALSEASLLALGAEGLDDYRVPIAWFEKRLSATPAPPPMYRHLFSNALGGLLLRAGRIDEAIARLNEGMAVATGAEGPGDWAYLAIAHARKGSFGEARKWLDRLRGVRHDPRESSWDVQELALLQGEAESLLLDAGFPSDPFAAPTTR